ncbi:MAG: hypothetical protein IJH09_03130 [Clostridia bacterium]|nr:hypothetical protein [Clostridia bacterium]
MQTTSAVWKALWAAGNAWLETRATIAGTVYTEMSNPVISRALTQYGLSIGNAVSATCQFSILTGASIPRAAEVVIEQRLNDGTTASEWLPAGTFYVSHRTRDAVTGLLTLECYDALLKANALWEPPSGAWPRTMESVATALSALLGAALDSRTAIRTGAAYVIEKPEPGTTIHDVLALIAAANGGNWIITPAGKLRLVPVVSAAGAASATEDVIDVRGVTGAVTVHAAGAVTGVRYQTDGEPVVLGDETGIVIEADVGAAIASDLYDGLNGVTYQAYSLNGAIYDPAAELGDYVRGGANAEVSGVLYGETVTLGLAFRGNISAPEAGELSDEYPYIGASAKTLTAAKVYAARQVAALDDSLDQESVFNRLTGNGAAQGIYIVDGQLYVNMSYARSGTLVLGGLNDANGLLQVLDAAGNVIGTWNNAGLTMDKGRIALKINNGAGTVTIGSGNNAIYYNYTDSGGYNYRQQMYNDTLYLGNRTMSNYTYFRNNDINMWRNTDTTDAVIGTDIAINMNNEISGKRLWIQSKYGIQLMEKSGSAWITKTTLRYTGISTSGSLSVTGTKSRRVATDQYSDRLLYCLETPSPMFADMGEGVIGADGRCFIALDAVFAQTVTTQQYQVFLQRYGEGDCFVAERRGGYFVVQGTPGLAFGWEVKAKQKDFDQLRLERADEPFAVPEQKYGMEAVQYITELKNGRVSA